MSTALAPLFTLQLPEVKESLKELLPHLEDFSIIYYQPSSRPNLYIPDLTMPIRVAC